jgi:colanic acid biosynthesis glycosyl transferase WcaI
VEAARCGICIEPENPPALAEAVRRIYQNPGLAQEYCENGRKFVEQHYSLDVCSTLYEQAFKTLIEQH